MAPSRVRIPPSPLAQRPPRFCAHPRRGGRAVECGGLENRYPSLGGSRVQIPPPPLPDQRSGPRREEHGPLRFLPQSYVFVSFWSFAATADALVGGVVRDQGVQDRDRIGCVDPATL